MIRRITKSIVNVPLGELNNFCVTYGCEIDIKNEEILIMEIENA